MTKRTIWTFMILALVALTMAACGQSQETTVPAPAGESQEAPVAADEIEETAEPQEEMVEEAAAAAGLVVFSIDPNASEVRFELDEVLRGNDVTVVGSTNQVTGEFSADISDLSSAEAGAISINAAGFATDNNFRNRAIKDMILDTGKFELITFTPTAVNDLPANAAVGDTIEFTIDGDLTVRDVTQPVTFTASVTVVSDAQLQGSASTIISRDDFSLTIPDVPSVAEVEPQVELYIDFVANTS